jgi:nucleotide-binding universal stress UspA family protein
MDDTQPTIVVGVGKSIASAAARRWAADAARHRGARRRVIRCWDPAARPAPYATAEHVLTPQQRRAAASDELRAVLHAEFGRQIPEFVGAELAEGVPERVLLARSAGAELLVLGSPGLLAGAGNPVGPVVRSCLSRALCPVVIVSQPPGDPAADDCPASVAERHPDHPAFGLPSQPRPLRTPHPALSIPAPRSAT